MRTQVAETSVLAFYAHQGRSVAQRERILSFIKTRGGDWSIGEIASSLMLEKSTVSARINELLATGELEVRNKRKDHVSSVLVRPVGLPVSQRTLF